MEGGYKAGVKQAGEKDGGVAIRHKQGRKKRWKGAIRQG